MGLRQNLRLLARRLWLIGLCAAVCGALAYGVCAVLPPVYESSVTLLVYQAPGSGADYTDLLTNARLVRTLSESIRSRPVLEAALAELGGSVTMADLEERVATRIVRDTQLIVVSVQDSSPQRAADTANAIARVFTSQYVALNSELYSRRKQPLEAQLADIRSSLADIQNRLDQPDLTNEAERDRLRLLLLHYRGLEASVIEQFDRIRTAEAQATSVLHTIDPAYADEQPIQPRTLLITALAAIGGALAVVIGISVRAFLVEEPQAGAAPPPTPQGGPTP